MFYPSLNTGMERIKVLSGLRLKEIIFPQDFPDSKYMKQKTVIRYLNIFSDNLPSKLTLQHNLF